MDMTTPTSSPADASATSTMRPADVIGKPVMPSCTRPTSESPDSSTTRPAATTKAGESCRRPDEASRVAVVVTTAAPTTCWKNTGT